MAITRFSLYVERAARLNLTLCPYQAADGRTFVAVSKGALPIADVEDKRLRQWLTIYTEQQAQLSRRPAPVVAPLVRPAALPVDPTRSRRSAAASSTPNLGGASAR